MTPSLSANVGPGASLETRSGPARGKAALLPMVELAFPYVSIDDAVGVDDWFMETKMIGRHRLAHVHAPRMRAEVDGRHATAIGFGDHCKLTWQLRGTSRYDDGCRSVILGCGQMLVTPLGARYHLSADSDCDTLMLVFDANGQRAWSEMAEAQMWKPIALSSATHAAAAGTGALLRCPLRDRDEHALDSLMDLALTPSCDRQGAQRQTQRLPGLGRARPLVLKHLEDAAYGPDQLADELGLSRRALYNRFAGSDITPAAFIRGVRLECARRDIEDDRQGGVTLTAIALQNGFPDSSSLSHAFKLAYGISPSAFRTRFAREQSET